MKIAISAANPSLDAPIDPRFGRCQYFLIIDIDTLEFDTVPNTSKDVVSGAGISAAQRLVNNDVRTLITGRVGPNAFDVLSSSGITIFPGAGGTVRETLAKFKNGKMQPMIAQQLTAKRWGQGRGRGMGRRRGGGFKHRPTQGQKDLTNESSSQSASGAPKTSTEQEIQMVEMQAQQMQQQLTQLQKRLNELKTEQSGVKETW